VVTQPDPINAPEKPMIAAVNPATHAALSPVPAPVGEAEPADGERDALKAEAVRLGLVTTASRLGAKALKDLISRAQSAVPAPAREPETFAQLGAQVFNQAPVSIPAPQPVPPPGFQVNQVQTDHGDTVRSLVAVPAPTGAILEAPAADAVLEAKIDAFFAALKPLLVAACK
jgi:hypothetical protein